MILASDYGNNAWEYSKQHEAFMFFIPSFIYAIVKYDMVNVQVRKDRKTK